MKEIQNNPQYIFLFILDAVRKDHLSLYGYQRKTTPNIDKLAKQSDVYQWAFAPSSYTLASVPSILTGKYPIELSNQFTGGTFAEKDFENFLKIKQSGYKTAMFTANIITSHYQTNLYKFFDYFWDSLTEKELNRPEMLYQQAEIVLQNVEKFVEKNRNKKLFIVIHLMEAHGPYTPNIKSHFRNDEIFTKDKRKITRVVNDSLLQVTREMLKKEKVIPSYQLLEVIKSPDGAIEDFLRDVNEYIAKYDMGIYLLDKNLGHIFNFLRAKKIFNQSKIIITSDHGELLGEENIFFAHGSICHPVLSLVPLIIKNPAQKSQKTINKNFSLVNLLKDEKNQEDEILVFHPQSIGLVKDSSYFMFHNGDFSHNGNINYSIFATKSFNVAQIFDNFLNFELEPTFKIFKKSGNSYKLLTDKKIKDVFLSTYLKYQKLNFKIIKEQFDALSLENSHLSQQLSQKDKEITNYKKQLARLEFLTKENKNLKAQIRKEGGVKL